MPDDITIRRDGTAEAAFAFFPAWHGLGVTFPRAMLSEEACKWAQLKWTVEQYPCYVGIPSGTDDKLNYLDLPYMANIRSDNQTVLGVVAANYHVVQNWEGFKFLDSLVSDEVIRYESAFSLNGGKKVVLVARLPERDWISDGDELKRYALLSMAHDGREAVRFGPTSVRVVCANTLALAISQGGIREWSIRHTSSVMEKLEKARDILKLASGAFDRHSEHCRILANRKLTMAEWDEYLDLIIPPISEIDPDYTSQRKNKLDQTRDAIRDAYDSGPQQIQSVRGSVWAAYNAISQHVDHLPRKGKTNRAKQETRFNVVLSGTGAAIKDRAFAVAKNIAGIGEKVDLLA
tara:strand:+ start:820 stop:1863 length:1044 start_codon:yes stop_codon:yes gene_type:complete